MRNVDVHPIIDDARLRRFHVSLTALCALLLIVDGYDVFLFGVVLPSIMDQWSLSPLQAGALGSHALFGMMFGALFFGTLADRVGRKWGIAACLVLCSAATTITGMARTPTEFGLLRFAAGLGCGGLMPNVVALMNEYAPRRLRSTLVSVMFSGYSMGGMLAAGVGLYVLPRFGWPSMCFVAALPLVVLPWILRDLPESVGFLVRRDRSTQAREILEALEPGLELDAEDRLQMSEAETGRFGVLELFREGRALRTLCLWLAFFCCLLMVYALSSWLPKLMANAGFSPGSSLSFLLALNLGGVGGAIVGGALGDRFDLIKVVVVFFATAALSVCSLGVASPTPALYTCIAIAGATTIGTQILLYAAAAQFYGMSIRSTGLGWASGMGRNGAIVGPLLGGALMSVQLPLQLNFVAFALPGAIAGMAMAVFSLRTPRRAATLAG